MRLKYLLLLPLMLLFFGQTEVSAKEVTQTVLVYPSSLTVNSISNDSIDNVLRYTNKFEIPISVSLAIEPITEPLGKNRDIIKQWSSLSTKEFTIKANSFKDVTLSINVPKEAEVGPYFFKVLADIKAINPPSSRDTIYIGNKLTTNITLRVKGKLLEKATIESIETPSLFGPKDKVDITIINRSNVSIVPNGVITLHNTLNDLAIPIDVQSQTIAPQSQETLSIALPEKLLWGKYIVEAQLQYGLTHQSMNASTSFYNLPIESIVISMLSGAFLFTILYFGIRHHDRVQRALYDLSHGK